MTVAQFWQEFLAATGKPSDTPYFECFHFGHTEQLANALLALVLSGKKRATASSLYAFEGDADAAPRVGDYSIVTDWTGMPHCVIETTAVTILPFCEVTFDLCKREGEDDNLESWQDGHRRFFTADGAAVGYAFSEDMPVVFEDFTVVYPK